MIFTPTEIDGAFIVEPELITDERGAFLRLFDAQEFQRRGLVSEFPQHSAAENTHRGTVRGLHFQLPPHEEAKLIRCGRGAIFDVIVDLRRRSTSFRRIVTVELHSRGERLLYVPAGCAHGYQTLEDDTSVTYLISSLYAPHAARGVVFDDSELGIDWPLPVSRISERDRAFPALRDAELP